MAIILTSGGSTSSSRPVPISTASGASSQTVSRPASSQVVQQSVPVNREAQEITISYTYAGYDRTSSYKATSSNPKPGSSDYVEGATLDAYTEENIKAMALKDAMRYFGATSSDRIVMNGMVIQAGDQAQIEASRGVLWGEYNQFLNVLHAEQSRAKTEYLLRGTGMWATPSDFAKAYQENIGKPSPDIIESQQYNMSESQLSARQQLLESPTAIWVSTKAYENMYKSVEGRIPVIPQKEIWVGSRGGIVFDEGKPETITTTKELYGPFQPQQGPLNTFGPYKYEDKRTWEDRLSQSLIELNPNNPPAGIIAEKFPAIGKMIVQSSEIFVAGFSLPGVGMSSFIKGGFEMLPGGVRGLFGDTQKVETLKGFKTTKTELTGSPTTELVEPITEVSWIKGEFPIGKRDLTGTFPVSFEETVSKTYVPDKGMKYTETITGKGTQTISKIKEPIEIKITESNVKVGFENNKLNSGIPDLPDKLKSSSINVIPEKTRLASEIIPDEIVSKTSSGIFIEKKDLLKGEPLPKQTTVSKTEISPIDTGIKPVNPPRSEAFAFIDVFEPKRTVGVSDVSLEFKQTSGLKKSIESPEPIGFGRGSVLIEKAESVQTYKGYPITEVKEVKKLDTSSFKVMPIGSLFGKKVSVSDEYDYSQVYPEKTSIDVRPSITEFNIERIKTGVSIMPFVSQLVNPFQSMRSGEKMEVSSISSLRTDEAIRLKYDTNLIQRQRVDQPLKFAIDQPNFDIPITKPIRKKRDGDDEYGIPEKMFVEKKKKGRSRRRQPWYPAGLGNVTIEEIKTGKMAIHLAGGKQTERLLNRTLQAGQEIPTKKQFKKMKL